MTSLAALAEKAAAVSDVYAARFAIRRDRDWFVLKLQEELGELTADVLKASGRGRLDAGDAAAAQDRIADEAADLLGFLLLFARHAGIDLEAALERKWFVHLDTAGAAGGGGR